MPYLFPRPCSTFMIEKCIQCHSIEKYKNAPIQYLFLAIQDGDLSKNADHGQFYNTEKITGKLKPQAA